MHALVDSANFFCSCERLFRPDLARRPVVVLSNNDGCVIARSEEAKALGIAMGAPFFKERERLKAAGVAVFSSNYALYGDLSNRVRHALELFTPDVEPYSIDESFLLLPKDEAPAELSHRIRKTVWRRCGIPVRVGAGPTKTLAKIANRRAKKTDGVCIIADEFDRERLLAETNVGEVWGVGSRIGPKLRQRGIDTALSLSRMSDIDIRRDFGIVLLRTVHELRGISCLPVTQQPPPRRSITHSRSFGRAVTREADLREAVATFVSRAAAKARRHKLAPKALHVFVRTGRHGKGQSYANALTLTLPEATHYTPALVRAAQAGLGRLWKPGIRYKKAGVILLDLVPEAHVQTNLFHRHDPRHAKIMSVVDDLNAKFGPGALRIARAGRLAIDPKHPDRHVPTRPAWQLSMQQRSPRYTTEWTGIATLSLRSCGNVATGNS
ncbi:MAG: Y-family DNA polymerase [Bacteroidota bacterium]